MVAVPNEVAQEELLRAYEVCARLKIQRTKLYELSGPGRPLSRLKIGRATRFRRSEVDRLIELLVKRAAENNSSGRSSVVSSSSSNSGIDDA